MSYYPLISLCVPIYGTEKYIERCACSLFEQTYDNIEYIFVNDCTKDKSMEILENIIDRYPHQKRKIKIINHEQNQGLAETRNTAIKSSSGDFIMWIDSDDYIDKKTVELSVIRQLETNADIVNFGCIKDSGHYKSIIKSLEYKDAKSQTLAILNRQTSTNVWGRLIRRTLYTSNNILAEKGVNMGEDYHVMPRLMYFAKITASLNLNLYYYDFTNSGSISHHFTQENNRQVWRAYDILYDFFKDKGNEYLDALQIACVSIVAMNLVVSYKSEARIFFYEEAKKRLSTVAKKHWKTQPLSKRAMFYLVNHPCVLFPYIGIAHTFRHLFLKIRHKLTICTKS